jgi:hypothetical protein
MCSNTGGALPSRPPLCGRIGRMLSRSPYASLVHRAEYPADGSSTGSLQTVMPPILLKYVE